MDNQPTPPSPQDILAALRVEAVRQSQLLDGMADDVMRMRRVIVMIGWLIILGGAAVVVVLLVNSWGF